MIEGLMVTMTGEEVQRRLGERVEEHLDRAAWWKREADPASADTEEECPCPQHICENEAERCEWRADVLEFIRDHIDPSEVYRLSHADLELAELLPPRPGWLEQDEYEQRTRVGFQLERLTRELRMLPDMMFSAGRHEDDARGTAPDPA